MPKFRITLDVEAPDGGNPRPEDLYEALESALDEAARDPGPMLARIEEVPDPGPAWVIRKSGSPDMILDGVHPKDWAWVPTNPDDVPDSARHASGLDLQSPPRGAVWCREDLLEGTPVLADLHSDDRVIDRSVDVRPWLMTAEAGEIEELAGDDWGYAESADRVAYALEGAGDPSAVALFHYLGLHPESMTGDAVGFGLSVDGEAALSWLRKHRPEVHAALDLPEDDPDGP